MQKKLIEAGMPQKQTEVQAEALSDALIHLNIPKIKYC